LDYRITEKYCETIKGNTAAENDLLSENPTSLHFSNFIFTISFYPEGKSNGP